MASLPVLSRIPLHRRSIPRLFLVIWDNSKVRTRDHEARGQKHEAYGTRYPNGTVTLDNRTMFENIHEMTTMFELRGNYTIQFLDEMEEEEEV